MKKTWISLLALGLLAACQRTPDQPSPPAAVAASASAAEAKLDARQKLELDLMRAVFGNAVRMVSGQAQARLPEAGGAEPRDAMTAIPLGVQVMANGQAALVTSAIPSDSPDAPGERPSGLAADISAYLLAPAAGGWKVERRHESIGSVGSHGETGDLAWLDLGQGRTGFAIEGEMGNRGQTIRTLTLFDLGARDMALLPSQDILIHNDNDGDCGDERPRCWNVSGRWRVVPPHGQAPAELEISFQGVLEQRADDAQPKARPEGEPADNADDIPPREKRQVKATARYVLEEKGWRLLSGENIAEGIDG